MALALCAAGAFGATDAASAQPDRNGGGHPYSSDMSPEAQAVMQKHWNTVESLRRQLFARQAELDAKIASGAGDSEVGAVARDINKLSAGLNEAQARTRQEAARQGVPPYGGPVGGGNGYRGGMGYAHGGPGCCLW
jgi:hypothetical protein